ncbi:hypothetical protein LMH87_006898 [Akanthomyces muscarius]|uniref:Uncharacterized protein n=1 Tax=Akanthomyces muscarius TaxID=2231603 RepID=A0A9W8QQH9_AKAMU|nr:hypothetical protein LMH87_006898 [Akanthomyces muscarius]KAJ4165260.1 hypothetical protein LMH87_006898 [Akanthomyces muscarius]
MVACENCGAGSKEPAPELNGRSDEANRQPWPWSALSRVQVLVSGGFIRLVCCILDAIAHAPVQFDQTPFASKS